MKCVVSVQCKVEGRAVRRGEEVEHEASNKGFGHKTRKKFQYSP